MTFKRTPDATFPFTAQIPNGSKPLPHKLIGKRKAPADLAGFRGSLSGRTDIDILEEILAGWEDVDAEFGRSALEDMLNNYASYALAVAMAYMKAHTEAERKN